MIEIESKIGRQDRHIKLVISVLLFLFITSTMPGFPGFLGDMECWRRWATYINDHGLENAYGSGTDYTPFYQYVLWIFGKLAGSSESIGWNIGFVRVFTLAADYWALWTVYLWIDRRLDYTYLLLCSLLNIAYSYDSIVWGQIDAILAAFLVAAFYHLYRGRRLLSTVFFILALNTKLQAIIFTPMWGLLMISSLHRDRRWREAAWILLIIVVVQGLILLPFALGKEGLTSVWNAVAGLATRERYTSMNAYNMWYWIIPGTAHGSDNVQPFDGISYRQIGLISFFVATLVALWPLIRHTIQTLRDRQIKPLSREVIWLTAALVALTFFFFGTGIHERYSYYAFVYFTSYAFYRKKFGIYILFSFAYLLNLDKVLRGFKLTFYDSWIFNEKMIAGLFAVCIIGSILQLYRFAAYKDSTEASAH